MLNFFNTLIELLSISKNEQQNVSNADNNSSEHLITEEELMTEIDESLRSIADYHRDNDVPLDEAVSAYIGLAGTECISRISLFHMHGDPPDTLTLTLEVKRKGAEYPAMQYDFLGTIEEFSNNKEYDCKKYCERIMSLKDTAIKQYEAECN